MTGSPLTCAGNFPCQHSFVGGLCLWCLCPETLADLDRSIAALREYARRWNAGVLAADPTCDHESCLTQAHTAHRRGADDVPN